MRHAKRVDRNHAEIRDGLRALGYQVLDLSAAGQGVADLVVAVSPGMPHFLEIKDGKKPMSAQALTKDQEEWHRYCWQITSKVTSLESAVNALKWAKSHAE